MKTSALNFALLFLKKAGFAVEGRALMIAEVQSFVKDTDFFSIGSY
jgi:hypothetical protein